MTAAPTVYSRASLTVQPVILPREVWPAREDGALRPIKGSWHARVVRNSKALHDTAIIVMIACPSCGGLLFTPHTDASAKALARMLGRSGPNVPKTATHSIDAVGKISPDVLCMHERCDFHRRVYLDKWNKTKPLYCIAYTKRGSLELEFAYCHASDQREALFHLGGRPGDFVIVEVAPAVGYFVADEKKGTLVAQ
jgi:hypothetical protein